MQHQVFSVLGIVRITQTGFLLKVALPLVKYALLSLALWHLMWLSAVWTRCRMHRPALPLLEHAFLCFSHLLDKNSMRASPRQCWYYWKLLFYFLWERDAVLPEGGLPWDSRCVHLATPKVTVRGRVLNQGSSSDMSKLSTDWFQGIANSLRWLHAKLLMNNSLYIFLREGVSGKVLWLSKFKT